jgi:3-oxoadipate enol-lactonase
MKELLQFTLEGQGPLVVLLHPVGLDGRFWYDLPKRLSDQYSVACVDLRGHGRSTDILRPGTMQANVEDVADVIKAINRGKAVVLGLSFGGMVAQNLVLKHPDLVSGLVICACGAQVPHAFRQTILARGTDAEKGGMQAVTETTLERWFTPAFMNAHEVEQVRQRLLSNQPSNFSAAWEAISEHDAVAQLAQVKVPVMVVGGSHDLATSLEAIAALANAFGHAHKVILEGAPHMMQIENQDEFYNTVRHFLDGMGRL